MPFVFREFHILREIYTLKLKRNKDLSKELNIKSHKQNKVTKPKTPQKLGHSLMILDIQTRKTGRSYKQSKRVKHF